MLYLEILKFSFLRFFAYPYEILASVLRHTIEMLFFIYFWSLVSHFSKLDLTIQNFASYFLIASGVSTLVMAQYGEFGSSMGRFIKMGIMSNFLLKPYHTLLYLHAAGLGRDGIHMIVAIAYILLGLIIQPPPNIISSFLFALFFLFAYIISMAINVIFGTMYFHFIEANGVYNMINHVIRVFSGLLVPIYLFPSPFYEIVKLSPFPGMVFGPTNALKTSQINQQVLIDLFIVIFWSVVLTVLALKFWKESMKKYEAVGI